MLIVYPSVEGDIYYIAFTQALPDGKEHPIVFVARCITRIELRYVILTILVSLSS